MLIMSVTVNREEESASGCDSSKSAQVHVVGGDDVAAGGN